MKQVIIYPGRFQPMLSHHAEVYSQLQSQFPEADVYIGTSDKVESGRSPFTFAEKQQIATAHGIDPSKVLQAKRPYHKDDYPFDEENTVIVFAVGEKDMDRFPFSNVNPDTDLDMMVKDNSKPKYYQKINTYRTDPKPMAERGYITLAPTISVDNEVASASAFRDALKNAPDKESAEQVYTKQFGNFDPKIFELIYGKITGQNDMNEELNNIRKLAGMQPLTESFDPSMEPSDESTMFDAAMDAYDDHGEDGLAQHLGMSSEEFDAELNELSAHKGLHADDDRDELVQLLVQDLIDERDVKQHEETTENTKDEVLPKCELCKGEGCDACGGTGEEDGYIHRDLGEKNPDGYHHTSNEPFDDPEGPGAGDEKVIPVNKAITLSGDSIWDEDNSKNPESVNVASISVIKDIDEDDYAVVNVEHDGPWTIYTDTGFEEEISKIVGFKVSFTEQGMQEEGVASMEGNTSDKGQTEDLDRMRHLAGLEEAEMPDFDKGERPRNSKERVAYRNWKKDSAAGAKDDDVVSISPKDKRDAEARPANAAAADPSQAQFTDINLDTMKVDGKSIPSKQRAKSIANQIPDNVDLNDPAVKKEAFLKFTAKRPDLMLGEINARLTNDDAGLALSDRLSPIVRQLEDSRNIMELDKEDKAFALKILNTAINNMELVKSTDIDKQIDVEPMQMDVEDEPEIGDDDMVPVLDMEDDDDEFEKESIDLSSIRAEYGVDEEPKACEQCGSTECECEPGTCECEPVNEGKMKDVIQDAHDMSKEEFEQARPGFDYDEILAEYPIEEDIVDEAELNELRKRAGLEVREVEEGKLPAGLQAYQDKKNGKKDDADKDDKEVDEDKDEDKDEVDERAECHSKDHDCATKVIHPTWGEGKPMYESHAVPTNEGYVAWYDVEFDHGIEKEVPAQDMEIITLAEHGMNASKFKPHMMYDPKTGEGKMAKVEQDHLDMKAKGWGHEKPELDETIEDIVDEAVESTIDVAINELKQLAGI